MRCILPGGLPVAGAVEREVALHPLTGAVELLLAETALTPRSWPEFVTLTLATAVAAVGRQRCDERLAAQLCVADRQYLMLQLARVLHGEEFWVTAVCSRCESRFDLGIRRSELPIKSAGPGYPGIELELDGHRLVFRLPNGSDQTEVAALPEAEALAWLVRACLLTVDGRPPPPEFVVPLDAEALERLEAAMDAVSPDVGTRVLTCCPECNVEQTVAVDPYGLARGVTTALFEEIHSLASYYHWNEPDILALPRDRRRLYLKLIDRDQGRFQ
ncbi:MAG: hypothetical protein U1F76_31300 [Candidatus Competibacteraceae bacterium]